VKLELPPLEHDPEDVRDLAAQILTGPEYAPPARSWVERALDWIGRQLDRLFGGDGGLTGEPGSGGSSLLTLLLLVAAVALVVFLLVRWRRPGRRRPEGDDIELHVEERRSVGDWDAAARRAEEAGDWKEGLRCRFGALVGRLVVSGSLPQVPGRTAGEFRGDLRASAPEAAEPFAEAADLFERAWYGDLPTGPAEAERFAAHAGRVLAVTGTPR
jgi:hypothetical protein